MRFCFWFVKDDGAELSTLHKRIKKAIKILQEKYYVYHTSQHFNQNLQNTEKLVLNFFSKNFIGLQMDNIINIIFNKTDALVYKTLHLSQLNTK